VSRSLWLLPVAALAALTACQAAPTTTTAPVNVVGSPAPVIGDTVPPDTISTIIAATGANTAVLLGPAIKQLSGLTSAYYDARYKYSRYRVLSGPEGWEFRHGWYWRTDNSEGRTLRAQFQDAGGVGQAYDVTFDVNYGPEMHPGFPSDLTAMRTELSLTLPSGAQLAVTFLGTLPASRTEQLNLSGAGAATAGAPAGSVAIEALSAGFVPGGDPVGGPLVLKSLADNATYQFSGQYNALGLDGTAKLYRNQALIGEVGYFDNQWQLRNQSGSYPLQ
jgi:hypothetical protein